MVEEHIHKLLFDHDCVIIPDFGGLITHYAPAQIHPVKHTFLPPSKRIAFNQKLKLNDGLLISTLAYEQHVTAEEAQGQVTAYVHQLEETLRTNQRYELKGIGLFYFNAEHKIQFDYLPADNLLNDSFGLPEISSHPISRTEVTQNLRSLLPDKKAQNQQPASKPTWQRRLRRVFDAAAVLVIAGLSTTALYVISLQNEYSQSSLNPFALFNITTPAHPVNSAFTAPEARQSAVDFYAAHEAVAESEAAVPTPAPTTFTEPEATSTNVKAETGPENTAVLSEPATVNKVAAENKLAAPVKAELAIKAAEPFSLGSKKLGVVIKEVTNRYYIIAGGYSTLPNAQYSRKVANRHGAQGKVILPFAGSKLYRVSIADFDTKEEALTYLPQLKTKYGKNIWILNY